MKTIEMPMMSSKEVNIIDDIIKERQAGVCLEWGSGGSTLWFPRHDCVKSWLSIEHNGHYVSHLADKIKPNTQVVWEAEPTPYIDCVKLLKRRFDLVLIDGEDREACLIVARDVIKEDGVILLHDSGREEYQDFIRLYGGRQLSEGEKPLGKFFAHRGLTEFTL